MITLTRPAKNDKNLRLSKTLTAWKEDELVIISEAAAILGLNVSAFLRMASLDRAQEVLDKQRHRE